jgi:cyclic pyranopterin phosphate synthase
LLHLLQSEMALVPLSATAPGETAQRWGHAGADGQHDPALGEIGFISSVTQAFCGDCNRARLSTEGQLYLCLFASQGHDLRSLVRQGASDAQLSAAIAQIWHGRDDRYSELRGAQQGTSGSGLKRVEMSYIGG